MMKELLEKLNLNRNSLQRALRQLVKYGEIKRLRIRNIGIYCSNKFFDELNKIKIIWVI